MSHIEHEISEERMEHMNLQHLKYMVEVERVGSITKAATNLFMGQPNLSKAIKEVENEIGITVFKRSAKGVFPTAKGEEFLGYAKNILVQMDKIEALYKPETADTISFGVSVPRATYITHAFTDFVNSLDPLKRIDIDFRETNSTEAVNNVCDSTSSIALIRYDLDNEEYFMSLLAEKNLRHEIVLQFEYRILISAGDPLAELDEIPVKCLSEYIEIAYGDYEVPYLSSSYTSKTDAGICSRRIHMYERGSLSDLLTNVKNTFMWVSPIPLKTLEKMDLVQKKCRDLTKKYVDCLIYPASYRLNEYDLKFIDCLYKSRDSAAVNMQ